MEGSKVELRIEVDPATQPITGSAKRAEGDEHDFVGWTGLMGAIDRLLEQSEQPKENEKDAT